MKICVIGTYGVGKTTLCNQILKDLGDEAVVLPDMMEEGIINAPGSFGATRAVWSYHAQVLSESDKDIVELDIICDRSVIDPLIFARALGIKSDFVDACWMAASVWMLSYDIIVYVTKSKLKMSKEQALIQEYFTEWVTGSEIAHLVYVSSEDIFASHY